MIHEPICMIDQFGNKTWYLNGLLHREDGPSREDADGFRSWSINGLLHKEDGPAIQYSDGRGFYWLEGRYLKLELSINNLELQEKYPKLIESMIIYLVHNS